MNSVAEKGYVGANSWGVNDANAWELTVFVDKVDGNWFLEYYYSFVVCG